MSRSFSLFSTFLVLAIQSSFCLDPPKPRVNSETVGPCQACKLLVQSFNAGLERTARGKFEGGDAAWEESRLGSYANSEVRLVEIQEKLCSDVRRGQDQCNVLSENHESLIEDWWFKHQKTNPDLHKWLCIEKLNVCCPDHHFGMNCTPCPGVPDAECGGNGKCKGSGTRKGNGKCVCDIGYKGELCQECISGYFQSYKDEKKVLCSECHKSCQGVCTQAGPKGCVACKQGWIMHTELGCSDVDECLADENPCKGNAFCVNTVGSFSCLSCDKACNGCTGDGPDNCVKCADGYTLQNNVCTGPTAWENTWQGTTMRYGTYLGLCLSTCIIFSRNVTIAAVLGLIVAAYISLSEYSLRWDNNKPNNPAQFPPFTLNSFFQISRQRLTTAAGSRNLTTFIFNCVAIICINWTKRKRVSIHFREITIKS